MRGRSAAHSAFVGDRAAQRTVALDAGAREARAGGASATSASSRIWTLADAIMRDGAVRTPDGDPGLETRRAGDAMVLARGPRRR